MSKPNRANARARVEDVRQTLRRLFRRSVVMDMQALRAATGERSRRSLCRDLRAVGYLSSYTHMGRYYTLVDIPRFDAHGLWSHNGVGFSRAGTLKQAVVERVDTADRGLYHSELEGLVRVRVHNTLLSLVRESRIGREPMGSAYLYVSVDAIRATDQVERRKASEPTKPLPTEVVIAVLVEALQAAEGLAASSVVAERLAARAISVTAEQVEQVYAQHELEAEKKTAERPPPHSPR